MSMVQKTGIDGFDHVIGTLPEQGALITLCGDEGVGKTTLMMNVAASLAKQAVVLYTSTDQTLASLAEQFDGRLASNLQDRHNFNAIHTKRFDKVLEAIEQIEPAVVIVDTPAGISSGNLGYVKHIRSVNRTLKDVVIERKIVVFTIVHLTVKGTPPKNECGLADVVLTLRAKDRSLPRRMLTCVPGARGATFELGHAFQDLGPVL